MSTFTLTIRTPEADVFVGEVNSVALTTDGGDLQCFAQHASVTGSVSYSAVAVDEGNAQESYVVRNGMFLFDNKGNSAVLLALHAEKRSEMNVSTVKEYLKWVEEKLASGEGLSDFQLAYLEGEKLAIQKQMDEVVA